MPGKYDDIIDLPHPTSLKHPRMSMVDRGAQFAPFSALVGYEEAIAESSRLTQEQTVLTEEAKEELNRILQYIQEHLWDFPLVNFKVFTPDLRKDGGSYEEFTATVQKIDPLGKTLLLTDGRLLSMDLICKMELYRQYEGENLP